MLFVFGKIRMSEMDSSEESFYTLFDIHSFQANDFEEEKTENFSGIRTRIYQSRRRAR